MNNIFKITYFKILSEEKLKNEKWKYIKTFKNVEIYFNETHINDRLKSRYDIYLFSYYHITILKFINYLIDNNIFKTIDLKGFTIHETSCKVWISGVLQNDKKDNQLRIYISTFLPSKTPKYNKYDYFLEFNIYD